MQLTDILFVLRWWFDFFLIGIIFLSFSQRLFPNFFDKGYIFGKMLGSALITYTLFLIGVLHLLPFSIWESWLAVLLWLFILHFRIIQNPTRLIVQMHVFSLLRKYWKVFAFEEILFLACLFFWSWIRSFSPDIHGLEKYMDFGFVNSILRSTYFPPIDLWFPPLSINYYYFGHMITAVLTKLSDIPSLVTFNLMIATLFALSFTAAFSIGANLLYLVGEKMRVNLRLIISGLLSAFLLTLAGNLHILYAFFKAYPNEHPVPLWQLAYNPLSFPNSYWYPNATRFIYNTIHEFPIYSWVVSDLHGHVLDIPFVLTTIALLLAVVTNGQILPINNQKQKKGHSQTNAAKTTSSPVKRYWYAMLPQKEGLTTMHILVISFLLAVMYMTNAWDGLIYLLLAAFIIVYLQAKKHIHLQGETKLHEDIVTILRNKHFLLHSGLVIMAIIIAYGIFTLPYSIFFKPFVSGIGVLCAPTFLTKIGHVGPLLFEPDHCQRSPWWQLLILYGFFAFFAFSFLIWLARMARPKTVDWFIFLLILLSTLLIIIPEFIYAKDIYPAHYRANTMFKLVFQSFMMLSLVSGFTFVRLLALFKVVLAQKARFLQKAGLGLWVLVGFWLIAIVALYPYQAIMSYYGNLQVYHGLDGTAYLKLSYPTDYDAINWINQHIQGQPMMLEAQGDSYTDYERVSANTGLPTVLGWTVHEWLWRGTYDIPAPRITEVQTLYTATDVNTVKTLVKKYNIQYVFVGDLERQKYPTLTEAVFKQLGGNPIYQNGNTRIYKIQ